MHVHRTARSKVLELAQAFKAVAIIGPRQSGKTTLAKTCFPEKDYVSLENPVHREFASEDPIGFLDQYGEGAILDEIQRTPDLLSFLQERLDASVERGKFILTGSNNFLLLEKINQSLAGRAAYLDLLPFSLPELDQIPGATEDLNTVLYQGGYPPVMAEGIPPADWFPAYIRTYVERDVRQIKNIENLLAFERMLSLCAGRVGQLVNYTNLSIELGIDSKTVQSWLGILQASYILFLLPPYFRNYNKRVIKSPKLYFYDTGLACHLLRIQQPEQLALHPYRGALFENWVITELQKQRLNHGKQPQFYFWRDSSGHEIDLLEDQGMDLTPIEIKSGRTITSDFFKGLRFWARLTGRQRGRVIYGGERGQKRSDGMEVLGWRDLLADDSSLPPDTA